MSSATKLAGRCLCGEVTISVDGEHDAQPGACHCRMCQRWSGGVFLAFTAAADAVTVEGPVKRFQSTSFAERAFCGKCGTHLWMRNTNDQAEDYDLMPGLFDAAHDWPLRSEIYADKAMVAVRLEGDHPRKTAAAYEASNPHTK
ncbi:MULTISPECIES: GFA family protein [Roseobacteraceae]|uniref:Glutathione-dependent formaldehyde-activating enzyme n=1 Tax=Pseudosulfitobacter pseudonitzschiae TaxID=1402135 RepID=A0A221JW96_9RHOB|nr:MULTISPECIES: GFA family protein [Roseobacteraceae]ASM71014.1 glutathione-dependent formaldehyde-activating enzyme [Pseudosulfitobacter pseudonitzschiae]